MHPILRLSINSLAGRRSRTALLVAAVGLATTLIAAVACALASLNAGMELRVTSTIGRADLRIRHVSETNFDVSVLETARRDADVELAVARLRAALPLIHRASGATVSAVAAGIDPEVEYALVEPEIAPGGRRVEGLAEIVIDATIAEALGVGVGDSVGVNRPGTAVDLLVVGISERKWLEIVPKPDATVHRATLAQVSGTGEAISEVQVVLREGADAESVAARLAPLLPPGVMAEPTTRVTSGLNSTIRTNNFLYTLASILSFIAAAFIVLTGLTTSTQERQRELAIMRCIGATRAQLALAQLCSGGCIGVLGAVAGVPLGIALTWLLTVIWPDRLRAGLVIPPGSLSAAAAGPILSGLLGAVWPAISAARAKPMVAMRSHALAPSQRATIGAALLALAGIAAQAALLQAPLDAGALFWSYALVGLPLMFVGYFLLGVPVVIAAARLIGPPLSRVFRLPRSLLERTVLATPFRHGFTAGALMVGLAMMTSIWTNGSAILRDWLSAIDFPDAFVNGWLGLSENARDTIEKLPFVTDTCAITLMKFDTDAFGAPGFLTPKTTFVAFEPEPFFAMTKLHWAAGDEQYARRRLAEGGAVLVAREFLVQRTGYSVGDTLTVNLLGKQHEFEIVGAVSSPGLDIVNKFFDIGKEYSERALHSVFGTRDDLKRIFGSDAIHLIQIGLDPRSPLSDAEVSEQLRAALGPGPYVVGSGREIREGILEIGRGSMRIASIIAAVAMLIGCFGASQVVVAGIDARRFEFGVLRAIGADSGLLARLLVGEVMLIALTACILGTLLGLQESWASVRLHAALGGLELKLRPPPGPIAAGWAMLFALTLSVTLPIILRLSAQRPRELLAATRG